MHDKLRRLNKLVISAFMIMGLSNVSMAVPITSDFTDYPDPVSDRVNITGDINDWYYDNYGLSFNHMYLYEDSRDAFDNHGVANGWVEETGLSDITGEIHFVDTTNFVTVDWWRVFTFEMEIEVYNSNDELLAEYSPPAAGFGSVTITADDIAKLELEGVGGFSAISNLTYDYDGVTDGVNVDIDDMVDVAEPGTLVLLSVGMLGFLAGRKK